VSNGVYQSGSGVGGGVANRVAVAKLLRVQSVNGPGVTTIGGGVGLRCAYLTGGVIMAGFTLRGASGIQLGAGAFCETTAADAVISNCVFTANHAISQGSGVYGGMINNCVFTNNSGGAGAGA